MAKPIPMLPPRREDSGVDADQLTVQIKQRTAGVAPVDGGIGLDEIFQPFEIQAAAPQSGDNSGGGGLA